MSNIRVCIVKDCDIKKINTYSGNIEFYFGRASQMLQPCYCVVFGISGMSIYYSGLNTNLNILESSNKICNIVKNIGVNYFDMTEEELKQSINKTLGVYTHEEKFYSTETVKLNMHKIHDHLSQIVKYSTLYYPFYKKIKVFVDDSKFTPLLKDSELCDIVPGDPVDHFIQILNSREYIRLDDSNLKISVDSMGVLEVFLDQHAINTLQILYYDIISSNTSSNENDITSKILTTFATISGAKCDKKLLRYMLYKNQSIFAILMRFLNRTIKFPNHIQISDRIKELNDQSSIDEDDNTTTNSDDPALAKNISEKNIL